MLPIQAINCLTTLNDLGYYAYLTGGSVRNFLCGKSSDTDDLDIVTNAPPAVIESLYSTKENPDFKNLCRFKHEGRSFDILSVADLSPLTLVKDARTRDFTINAFYLAMENGVPVIYDPLNKAWYDLFVNPQGQLQTIHDREFSFSRDPFLVMRYLYFLSKTFTGTQPDCFLKFKLSIILEEFKAVDKILLTTEEYIKKTTLAKRFDDLLCKKLLNGSAVCSYTILEKLKFFEIFFPKKTTGTDLVGDSMWIAKQMSDLNRVEGFNNKRNRMYAIILAEMIGPCAKDQVQAEARLLLQKPQFSANLSFKMDLREVETLIEDKKEFFKQRSQGRRAISVLFKKHTPITKSVPDTLTILKARTDEPMSPQSPRFRAA